MRTQNGRFAQGNPGGPGRPRRDTEREYLRAMADACPLSTWQEIIAKAVEDAKDGNAKAREWLGSYLLGGKGDGKQLVNLAAEEVAGIDPVIEAADHKRDLAYLHPSLQELSSV